MGLTQFILIFQCKGYPLVRHWWNSFDIYGETPATKEVMFSLVFLKIWNASLSCIFILHLMI